MVRPARRGNLVMLERFCPRSVNETNMPPYANYKSATMICPPATGPPAVQPFHLAGKRVAIGSVPEGTISARNACAHQFAQPLLGTDAYLFLQYFGHEHRQSG
jgi:hypothetical protein